MDTITAVAIGSGVFVSSGLAASARSEKRRELHGAFETSEETVEEKLGRHGVFLLSISIITQKKASGFSLKIPMPLKIN